METSIAIRLCLGHRAVIIIVVLLWGTALLLGQAEIAYPAVPFALTRGGAR